MASFPRNVVFVRIQTYSRMKIDTQEYTKVFTGTEREWMAGYRWLVRYVQMMTPREMQWKRV